MGSRGGVAPAQYHRGRPSSGSNLGWLTRGTKRRLARPCMSHRGCSWPMCPVPEAVPVRRLKFARRTRLCWRRSRCRTMSPLARLLSSQMEELGRSSWISFQLPRSSTDP
jgi:hypothetical protein